MERTLTLLAFTRLKKTVDDDEKYSSLNIPLSRNQPWK